MGAYAFWSMSDHANSTYLPAACMSRTPSKPCYNRYGDRKRARPPRKPLYLPSARVADREDGRRTTKTAPEAPSPRTPIFAIPLERRGPGGRGLGSVDSSSPRPLVSFMTTLKEPRALDPSSTHKLATPAHGGGGLPLPAAASAAPLRSCKNQGSAQSDGAKNIEHRRKAC